MVQCVLQLNVATQTIVPTVIKKERVVPLHSRSFVPIRLMADTSRKTHEFSTGEMPIILRLGGNYLSAKIVFVTDFLEFNIPKIPLMMRLKLLFGLLALLFTMEVNGQVKYVSVPVNQNGDTTGYYKIQRNRTFQMKMRDPLTSKDSLLIRVSTENWSVEVISRDLKTFEGRQYFFTTKLVPSEGRRGGELFSTKSMTKAQALAIYRAFQEKSIASIPNERDINGWPLGADGIAYVIEHSTASTYSLKSYWEPSSARYQLKEGVAVQDFVKTIETELEMATSLLAFLDGLPAGTYHTGGITAYTNKAEKRKSRK